MSKASAARRLATGAAYGGGGLTPAGRHPSTASSTTEAKLARLRIGNANDTPPNPSGLYGFNLPGQPLRLSVLGDSAAAGYGATDAARDVRRLSRLGPGRPRPGAGLPQLGRHGRRA